jgi:uncharacterized SAM-binding protein YcdF (DUF218 family)
VGASQAGAIVVLSGDIEPHAPETATGATIGAMTLTRLRHGAVLGRRLGLPLLLSGGVLSGSPIPEATLMAESLVADFNLTPGWIETRSRTTCENARYTAEIMRAHGIAQVYLVTHAWHMRRALLAFRLAGIEALPAPTGFTPPFVFRATSFVPSPSGYRSAQLFFHELVGRLAYGLTCA